LPRASTRSSPVANTKERSFLEVALALSSDVNLVLRGVRPGVASSRSTLAATPELHRLTIMNVSLRAPTDSDYAAIASWVPDAAAGLRWAGPRLPFPFAASDLRELLAVPGGGESSYCLIDESGNPCGFGQHWVLQPGAVHLGRIIVTPDARGHGFGRALCQQLISAALRSTSAAAITLRAYRDNLVAVGLYSSLGFVEVASESTDEVLFMKLMANAPSNGRSRR